MIQNTQAVSASDAGTLRLGDFTVNRLGYGAMRITGKGIWGPPLIAMRRWQRCGARSSSE